MTSILLTMCSGKFTPACLQYLAYELLCTKNILLMFMTLHVVLYNDFDFGYLLEINFNF